MRATAAKEGEAKHREDTTDRSKHKQKKRDLGRAEGNDHREERCREEARWANEEKKSKITQSMRQESQSKNLTLPGNKEKRKREQDDRRSGH